MAARLWLVVRVVGLVALCPAVVQSEHLAAPLVLQEMGWVDVRAYLENNDMVIIPLGSTEQHGPHLPLGSDSLQAMELAREVSRRTGVVVAPVLWVGYSQYHLGFPGGMSISPETMEQVLFECVSSLIQHGFRRIMFLNRHGGNEIVQERVIHRINHTTAATGLAIGIGNPVPVEVDADFFDWHAGKTETSFMLHLRPDLVRMERAQRPDITLSPRVEELRALAETRPELLAVMEQLLGVPAETGKSGASDEISSNGVWSFTDPRSATSELGQRLFDQQVDAAVQMVEAWKLVTR